MGGSSSTMRIGRSPARVKLPLLPRTVTTKSPSGALALAASMNGVAAVPDLLLETWSAVYDVTPAGRSRISRSTVPSADPSTVFTQTLVPE